MWIERLQIQHFRCITEADLYPCRGLNVILGANGAGKTSVLEAIGLAASGRSFRTSKPEDMLPPGGGLMLAVDVNSGGGTVRIGLRREQQRWQPRLNGESTQGFSEIAEKLAVEVFEPNSHEIISGGSEGRRRFLDWGVFHVEHGFGPAWTRYQRALKQRNSLLRSGAATAKALAPWDRELAQHGTELTEYRRCFVDLFRPILERNLQELAPELGASELNFKPGWTTPDLSEALTQALERDLAVGHTTRGPHRADWALRFANLGSRERWSRGQQKIGVFGLCRAMLDVYAAQRQEYAVACLDDVFSELDQNHQELCLHSLERAGSQIWLTSTTKSEALSAWNGQFKEFHVEQGHITAVGHHRL